MREYTNQLSRKASLIKITNVQTKDKILKPHSQTWENITMPSQIGTVFYETNTIDWIICIDTLEIFWDTIKHESNSQGLFIQ